MRHRLCESVHLVVGFLLLFAFGSSSTAIAQSWYNADIHLHANGCSNNNRSAAEILGLMKQEGINVGSILVWGGGRSLELDPVHFRGQEDDPVSEPNYIAHWDIEISVLPGDWHGHMDLLNVAQKDAVVVNQVNYPGQDYLLPNYQYVQSQGGIVGYGHGQGWTPGSYSPITASPKELPPPQTNILPTLIPSCFIRPRISAADLLLLLQPLAWRWISELYQDWARAVDDQPKAGKSRQIDTRAISLRLLNIGPFLWWQLGSC